MIGFVLDLDERVQDVKTNVFEIAMMTALCFGIISVFYFPIRVLIHKLAKKNFKSPLNSKGEKWTIKALNPPKSLWEGFLWIKQGYATFWKLGSIKSQDL